MFDHAESPKPTKWLNVSDEEKSILINRCLEEKEVKNLTLESFNESAQITFRIIENIKASERGLFLLNLESYLKDKIDEAITIWCTTQGDKSKLRNLRGVEIKA